MFDCVSLFLTFPVVCDVGRLHLVVGVGLVFGLCVVMVWCV